MKIWTGHGSEHSYNLVLIGRFADETRARSAEEKLERLQEVAANELPDTGWDEASQRFSDELLRVVRELGLWGMSRADIEGLAYIEQGIKREGTVLRVTTEDAEVQGFIKLMIDHGAKVEIFSAHHWTEEGDARTGDG